MSTFFEEKIRPTPQIRVKKECGACNQFFDASEFPSRGKHSHLCKACHAVQKKEYTQKYNRSILHRNAQKKYARTPEGQRKINKYQKIYVQLPHVKRRKAEWEKEKYHSCPRHRINNIMRVSIGRAIKDKNNVSWQDLVGYSSDDLKKHLEKQFRKGMTWKNHGRAWEIDHVKPRSMFKFKSFKSREFKNCWGLENLQPRWATTKIARKYGDFEMVGNSNKGAKFIG